MTRSVWLLIAVLMLAGCQHARPPVASGGRCALPAYPLAVSNGPGERARPASASVATFALVGPPAPTRARRTLGGVISDMLSRDASDRLRATGLVANHQVLVLSGGSQHGAFGAGLFAGLDGGPPYEVVTAVSTGALQSTFVFLAHDGLPGRRYRPYMSKAPAIGSPGRSNIEDLEMAYAIGGESDLLKVGKLGFVGAAVRGSLATFTPLRTMLEGMISDETLERVRAEARAHRRLLVGVADLDDGNGYALDLTRLVEEAPDVSAVRECYIDALIASATVPPGVPPVTLNVDFDPDGAHDVRPALFMDGGALFGVFFQQVRDAVAQPPSPDRPPVPTDVTLVVNGMLHGRPWLRDDGTPVGDWSVVSFGLRAVDLLQTQVYRFSVDDVEKWALPNGTLRMAFISNENLAHLTESPDAHLFTNDAKETKTCADFREEDRTRDHPQEFDARYMQCLIDYGRARGAADPWNHVVPKRTPAP